MGSELTLIGEEESEQLTVIPRQHYVIRFKRAKSGSASWTDLILGARLVTDPPTTGR